MPVLQHVVKRPDGTRVKGARVLVELLAPNPGDPGYLSNGSAYTIVGPKVTVTEPDGSWSMTLPGNDDPSLQPAGTRWRATIDIPGDRRKTEHIVNLPTTGGPHNLEDYLDPSPGAVSWSVNSLSASNMPITPPAGFTSTNVAALLSELAGAFDLLSAASVTPVDLQGATDTQLWLHSTAMTANQDYLAPARIDVTRHFAIRGSVLTDQAGTLYVRFYNASSAGAKLVELTYPVAANVTKDVLAMRHGPWMEIRYLNGATGQTTFVGGLFGGATGLTDALPHAATHGTAGSDPVTAAAGPHAAEHAPGGSDPVSGVAPSAHAVSHGSGGSDPVTAPSHASNHEPGGTDVLATPAVAELLTAGEETFSRMDRSGVRQLATQRLYLTYFTARRTETIATFRASTGSTAAAATPSLIRFAVYSVDGSGNLTLIHATDNDTTLFAGSNTRYPKALSTSWSKVRGTRYALGLLMVTAATAPTIVAGPLLGDLIEWSDAPRLAGTVSGQADLPATVTAGNVLTSDAARLYVAMLP